MGVVVVVDHAQQVDPGARIDDGHVERRGSVVPIAGCRLRIFNICHRVFPITRLFVPVANGEIAQITGLCKPARPNVAERAAAPKCPRRATKRNREAAVLPQSSVPDHAVWMNGRPRFIFVPNRTNHEQICIPVRNSVCSTLAFSWSSPCRAPNPFVQQARVLGSLQKVRLFHSTRWSS